MQVFHVAEGDIREGAELPGSAPAHGFIWIACTRAELQANLPALQACLQAVAGAPLVDLHVSDLMNLQLPSRHDFTRDYDLMVFRQLAPPSASTRADDPPRRRSGPVALRHIDTLPVGCVVFDRLLLSVHPEGCAVREAFVARLRPAAGDGQPGLALSRAPLNAADLMLRLVSLMVDAYLALRRDLSRQLDHWQAELLAPRTRFANWSALLDARLALHGLNEICEDQRTALLDWSSAVDTWPLEPSPSAQRERDLLKVRSRDVQEHVERVVRHVQRLENQIETTVQMHFNAQSHRTNEIMRTLTALTAVFLPLNLITGFFGMNFEYLPLVHRETGLWWAIGIMTAVAIGFALVLWRKRYLARTSQ